MGSQDFQRIDEVYHNIYKNKFHREEPLIKEEDAYDEDAEYMAKAKKHAPEAAKAIMHKLKLEYGDKFNPEKARAAVKHAFGSAANEDTEEELGPDPKDLAQYDEYEKARKEISFDKYPFWDAYHAVKEGAWSEEDFHQWAQTVWNAGAEESRYHH